MPTNWVLIGAACWPIREMVCGAHPARVGVQGISDETER